MKVAANVNFEDGKIKSDNKILLSNLSHNENMKWPISSYKASKIFEIAKINQSRNIAQTRNSLEGLTMHAQNFTKTEKNVQNQINIRSEDPTPTGEEQLYNRLNFSEEQIKEDQQQATHEWIKGNDHIFLDDLISKHKNVFSELPNNIKIPGEKIYGIHHREPGDKLLYLHQGKLYYIENLNQFKEKGKAYVIAEDVRYRKNRLFQANKKFNIYQNLVTNVKMTKNKTNGAHTMFVHLFKRNEQGLRVELFQGYVEIAQKNNFLKKYFKNKKRNKTETIHMESHTLGKINQNLQDFETMGKKDQIAGQPWLEVNPNG